MMYLFLNRVFVLIFDVCFVRLSPPCYPDQANLTAAQYSALTAFMTASQNVVTVTIVNAMMPSGSYTFGLTVANWLGKTASSAATVSKAKQALLPIFLSLPPYQITQRSADFTLQASTASNLTAYCFNVSGQMVSGVAKRHFFI